MGIKFKQIDNLQETFDSLSGSFDTRITNNTNDVSGVLRDSITLSGWKYFEDNVDVSGLQGLLVESDNIYTPNNLIAGGAKIGFPISSPRNSTLDPLGALQVTGGQIYFEDQLNIRNNAGINIENGSITGDSADFDYITGSTLNYTSGAFDQIGVGTNSPRSILDIDSTDSAPIMPNMTTAQMNAIANPIEGMLVYNTDSGKFAGYTGAWSLLH